MGPKPIVWRETKHRASCDNIGSKFWKAYHNLVGRISNTAGTLISHFLSRSFISIDYNASPWRYLLLLVPQMEHKLSKNNYCRFTSTRRRTFLMQRMRFFERTGGLLVFASSRDMYSTVLCCIWVFDFGVLKQDFKGRFPKYIFCHNHICLCFYVDTELDIPEDIHGNDAGTNCNSLSLFVQSLHCLPDKLFVLIINYWLTPQVVLFCFTVETPLIL